MIRPRRSLLFMPASNARALEKARALDADGCIFDLEDAVAPGNKALAREQAMAAVRSGGYGRAEIILRINRADTPWHEADVTAANACKPDAILLPKVEQADEVMALAAQTDLPIWCMIESPLAILNLREIASAHPQLVAFVAGTNDLAREMQLEIDADRTALLFALSQLVLTARAFGLAAIDGVHGAIRDLPGLERACEQGRQLGFDGKSLIHPDHIAVANRAFAPSETQIVQARSIIAAYDAAPDKGVIVVNGQMIESLHVDMARRTLRIAEAIG